MWYQITVSHAVPKGAVCGRRMYTPLRPQQITNICQFCGELAALVSILKSGSFEFYAQLKLSLNKKIKIYLCFFLNLFAKCHISP